MKDNRDELFKRTVAMRRVTIKNQFLPIGLVVVMISEVESSKVPNRIVEVQKKGTRRSR